jgi:NAD(P)-dependent dehydrogenase (short-subunit alcohol dehydrogenase family)
MKAGLLEQLGLAPGALAGKVAVVTGAGQGIGKELALALSMLGASVVLAEIKDTGAEVEAQIRAAGGGAQGHAATLREDHECRESFPIATGTS